MSAQGLSSRAIIGRFYERLGAMRSSTWLDKIAMPFDSDQASETYKFLGQTPAMQEWVGERLAKGLRENGLTIANKKFQATLKVSVDDIRRDKTGQVQVRIDELAERALTHEMSLVSTLLLNGATGLAYDGQYFFDTDHTEGDNSTNQANSITFDISDGGGGGTTTYPTGVTMQRAILAGISQILGFKDDQNEPLSELAKNFLVMTGPSLMAPAMGACTLGMLDSGAANLITAQNKFKIEPEVNARLSAWTDKFVVFRTDGATKAMINQEEEPVSVAAIAEGSEHEFKNDEHLYGVKRIGNAGYGMWQHACLVTFQA
jgi:phage major head subunit gpT-like protein